MYLGGTVGQSAACFGAVGICPLIIQWTMEGAALQGGEHGGASAPCCSSDRHAGPWSRDHGVQLIQLNDLDAKYLDDRKRETGRRVDHILPRAASYRVEGRLDRSG